MTYTLSKFLMWDASNAEANHAGTEGRTHLLAHHSQVLHSSGLSRPQPLTLVPVLGQSRPAASLVQPLEPLPLITQIHFGTENSGGQHSCEGSAEPLNTALTNYSDQQCLAGAVAHGTHID